MARLPRLTLPGLPHHLIQRGHNRQPIFTDAQDRAQLHALLVTHAREAGVQVHAWVFMDNHLHLLATPAEADSLARMMQAVGRRYVRHFNDRAGRSGTLWEGRYRCAPLQPERHLLDAMACLDLNPVRAGLVESPADWPHSSHRHYVGQGSDKLVTPPAAWWQLGNTPFAREQAYAERVGRGLDASTHRALVDSALHGWALGDEAFLAELQRQTGRRATRGRPGRPRTRTAD